VERHKQHAEDNSKNSEQTHLGEYRLDELLANSLKEAFQLDKEDQIWLAAFEVRVQRAILMFHVGERCDTDEFVQKLTIS